MPQQAVRFPDDLHSAIKAEADRRGKPHTFSSVLIECARLGLKSELDFAAWVGGERERRATRKPEK